jgi:hypothetical protein
VREGAILYSSPYIIKVIKSRWMRWAEHVICVGQVRNAYKILVGKPEGKRLFGRSRHTWEDIKMDLNEMGYENVD